MAIPAAGSFSFMSNHRFLISVALLITLLGGGVFAWRLKTQAQINTLRLEAKAAILKRDWTGGKQLCRRWLKVQPENAEALLLLAQAHSELQEWQQTIELLEQVPESDPRRAAALIEKSEIEWSALNLPFEGLETAKRAILLKPEAIQAHARIIAFYAMTFQRSQMVSAIRQAIRSKGEPREAYLYLVLADEPVFVNAIDLNGRWLAAEPDSEQFRVGLAIQMALHVFLDAVAQAKEEAYEKEKEALVRLNEFTEQYPTNTGLLSVLLEHAIEEGNQDRVAQLLQKVPSGKIQDHIIWTAKGWFHMSRNELKPAEASFLQALKLHPASGRAQHEYASLLRLQGRIEQAQETQKRAGAGIELRNKILKLKNAREASWSLMEEIKDYFELCGDTVVAEALSERLKEIPSEGSQ